MKPRIKAVLFDLYGVLTNDFHGRSVAEFCDTFGVHPATFSEIVAKHLGGLDTGEKTEKKFFEQVASDLPVDFSGAKLHAWFDKANRHYFKRDKAMWALKEDLEEQGIVVALVTNISDGVLERISAMGHLESFEFVYYSSRLGIMKPWVEYFEHVRDDLGLPFSQLLLIDDTQVNVESALTLGMHAVLHTTAVSTIATLHNEYGLVSEG